MILQNLIWLNNRLRPSEGWLVFLLLCMAVSLQITAVLEVGWVPEDGVVMTTAVLGLLLGIVLAKRPFPTFWAWLLLALYGLLLTTIILAQLLPPLTILDRGWEATHRFWLQNSALFLDRMGGWGLAAFSGDSSQETIAFAFGLGLLTFILAAYAGWTTFRQQRPLRGLMMIGMTLAVNGYYGAGQIQWLGLFVGLAALLTAVVNYARLEQEWNADGVDYPEDTRLELAGYAAFIAAGLLAMALLLPAFSITKVQAWFASLTAVAEAESTLGQAFGGVDVPRTQQGRPSEGSVGGSGILPRSYLLGNAPELSETVVMTAVVAIEIDGELFPTTSEFSQGTHWRSLSYDIYTGKGWAISEERRDPTDAFQPIPVPTAVGQTILNQTVHWQRDNRVIRYTTGLPTRFDHPTIVSWRGLTDLARVRGSGNVYQATSRLSTAAPEELRQAGVEDVPPALLAHYTKLPDSVPRRVSNLAQEVTGEQSNPYDQARALEVFLRQYPYSLDVDLPPPDNDPVDYFLFDLQTGYCDYYASSMVVMARSLGLPARLVVGFLAQPPAENRVQTIRQVNGHSWVEIYFADYGWVEFEPTTAFPTPRQNSALTPSNSKTDEPSAEMVTPPPIPDQAPARPFPWFRLLIVAIIGLGVFVLWQRGWADRALQADQVVWAYGRLQQNANKLGHPSTNSQTPTEFTTFLLEGLDEYEPTNRLGQLIPPMRPAIKKLTRLYNQHRYAKQSAGGQDEARRIWKMLRRPFWQLRLARLFSRRIKTTTNEGRNSPHSAP
ncbi:MAG: transglutaminase domain-containing protein [Chloroflexi bacterium]|nr:transglutaminase domain-containing protein [Chloroflexota bacterium]